MQTLARILGALALFAFALFCGFGFLASFEPGNGLPWQVGYRELGCGCLTGAVALLGRPQARTLGGSALLAVTMFCVLGILESYLSLPGQVAYGAVGCGGLVVAVALLRPGGGGSKPRGADNAR